MSETGTADHEGRPGGASPAPLDVGAETLDRLNQDFEDSVSFVARVLGAYPGATTARITAVDGGGVDMVVTDPAGEHPDRVAFAAEVTDEVGLSAQFIDMVLRARQASGEEGATSAERMVSEMSGIRTMLTTVARVEDVNRHLRSITFTGDDLAGFSPVGPDTFLYVLLPPPGRTGLTIGRDFSWEAVPGMPESERPVGAYYTVRHWRPDVAELDMLFVLHDDTGPASAWAARARPGDPVALWGPRTAYEPPPETDWYLLVADETGLPAVARIIETAPEGIPVRVFAEVADATARQDLPARDGVEVTWLHRDGAPAGTTTLIPDAVRALPWPGGTPYAWGGGESRALTAVRRYLRREVGLPREAVSLVAYWRHAEDTTVDDGE